MWWVGGKRGAIYIKERFLAQSWVDINSLGLSESWELENDVDIGAMRLWAICLGCMLQGSVCNVVPETGLW